MQNSYAPDVRAPENAAADTGGSRLSPLSPSASHSPGGRRIGSLDAMRGFALCGIAFVNVPALWRLPYEAGRDNSVQEFLNQFVQQRFFPIFSLLFGIGFGLMWTAACTRAARPRVVMFRCFAVLAVLGFAHQFFHPGEALLPYALVAMVVLFPLTFLPERAQAPIVSVAGLAALAAAMSADGGVDAVPGLLLIGFALALLDVPRIADGNLRFNAIAFAVSAPLAAAGAWAQASGRFAEHLVWVFPTAGIALAAAYCSFLGLLMSTPARRAVEAVFAPLGRMSLTNYIGATLLFWAVKDALALFGVVDDSTASWSAAMGVVAGILVVQWAFSAAWLTFFRQGPLEWLWRKATWAGAKPA